MIDFCENVFQAHTPKEHTPTKNTEHLPEDFTDAIAWLWARGVEVYGRRFELGWRGAENLSEATIEQARLLVERHKDEFMGIAPLQGYSPDYALFCDEYGRGGCLSCKEYMPNETRFCRAYNLRFHGSEIVTVTIEETPANQKKAACYWSKGAAQ